MASGITVFSPGQLFDVFNLFLRESLVGSESYLLPLILVVSWLRSNGWGSFKIISSDSGNGEVSYLRFRWYLARPRCIS
jgi:hypothetical protein